MITIINQTLMEQMKISERDIGQRMHMFDFTDDDISSLVSCAPFIRNNLEAIVDEFYESQLSVSEIAMIIGDADTLGRLKMIMSRYIPDLFSGHYDESYVNSRLRIGKVHKRLSVSPKLYMASLSSLQTILDGYLDRFNTESGDVDGEKIKEALHKILLFDAQLIFDAYIDTFMTEVDSAKIEVERYASKLEVKVAVLTRQLHDFSTKDSLTDLYNQRAFQDFLKRECAVAERHTLPLCLIYFDLNGFKGLNDTRGHLAGDSLLKEVGAAMYEALRTVDIPCRYGGDEFCIIMPRTDVDQATIACERLIEIFTAQRSFDISFSLGIAQTGPGDVATPEDLVRAADGLMYEAKLKSKTSPGFQIIGRKID